MAAMPSYHLHPSNPSWTPPALACNTHCHIMGPVDRFPYAKNRTYTPQTDAPKEALFALHDQMGIDRCVMVQAGCHGFKNSAVADAIATKNGSYLGVALLPVETSVGDLKRSAEPVVIDHMGRVDASLGLEQPAFTALKRLLEDEKFWVKVSGSERCTRQGPPYSDAIP